jgi:cysteine desulfurase/selenocysteine lyase
MDIKSFRDDFPVLQEERKGRPVVYFDNACQTLRPVSVIEAVNAYYQHSSACVGRSNHKLAEEVTRACEDSRSRLAKFLHASKKEEIIFTRNTTEGINLVAHSLGLNAGDVVLISDKEHNSNLIPWQVAAKRVGIEVRIIPTESDGRMDLDGFRKMLSPEVRLISVGMTSNLDGVNIPTREIIQAAHKNGSLVLLDAAQSAPHMQIDVRQLDADFVAFSGHKMLGPSGIGVLYGKYALLEKMEPFLVGGETVAISTYTDCRFLPPPEKFEAGLQDYAGIIGLGAAVEYLQKVGFDAIQKQDKLLNFAISSRLTKFPRVKMIGPTDPNLRSGIATFWVEKADHHQVAIMLDQVSNIAVRSGQHCVHSWFNSRGIPGSVRASVYFYNTLEEVDVFIESLQKILKVI